MGCCCEWRTPTPLRFVLPSVIIGVILYLYTSFMIFAHSRVLKAGASISELLVFNTMTFLLCWSLTQTLRSSDSFLPQHTLTKEKLHELKLPGADPNDVLVETKMNGAIRTCRKCRTLKPDRAHHCSTCRRCVLKMDHHCIYINKCIGYFNYKFFILFLGWSASTCLYQSSLLFRYVLAESLDRAGTLYFFGKLGLFNPHLQTISVFFGSAVLGLALACFYLMHLYFVINNFSTLEYCEKRDDPDYINYYNVGIVRNFQEVFGTSREFLYWFLPVHSPSFRMRDGRTFPLNSKYVKND
ncbi:zinc finger protein [Plasmopara halstedii]|uniref:Palmitoyltransferase n=1 Tax=Plasmopara halstedii TaxID=4781 RepID=A0A0P1ALG3_PLAHL|nr:zinc finger protein [Plasmopara halstedii]CEG41943.1 zinc finger protein [Plasmopara halstedii]|eukprot:XP_024578312.1 zinc finger protein [Plasmopara halstedii]